ncbi:MAG: PAS domain-containing protein [Luteolibacter sp.]
MNSRFHRVIIGIIGVLILSWLAATDAPRPEKIAAAAIVFLTGIGLAKIGHRPANPDETSQAFAGGILSQNKQLQEKIHEIEERHATLKHYYDTLMEHLAAKIYFKDQNSRFIQVNQSMAEHLRCSHPADLHGKTDHDFFDKEHADQTLADEQDILKNGKSITDLVEKEVFPDGKIGWVLTTKMPFRDKSGNIIGTFGMSSVITDLVETQQALERERYIFRCMIDSFPDQIFVRDSQRRYMIVNKAMAEWVGAKSPDEMLNKLPEEYFGEELSAKSAAEDHHVLETGEPVIYWDNHLTSPVTGEVREFMTTKVPLLDAEGHRWGIVAMIRDVTEQRRAREKLLQSERRMQDVIDNSPAVIYLKDLEGKYLMVNLGFEHLFELKRADILGRTDSEFIADQNAAEKFREHDLTVIEREEAIQMDEELIVDGQLRTYVAMRFPIRDLQGKVIAVGGISTDITDRREAEEAMQTLNEELYQANQSLKSAQEQLIHAEKMESIGRLAAGVAHEVKNPLAMIGMGLEVLARRIPESDEKGQETVDRMKRGIDRAKKIIKGLVDYSSARQLTAETGNINEVVKDSLALTEYPLRKGGVNVELELAENPPPVHVDSTKMEQVLVNLMINAMHAMPEGGDLKIRTSAEILSGIRRDEGLRTASHLREGDHVVRIEVMDRGSGITEENRKKLFDPFFTTKATGTGTGLGLAVSRKIIELHHGTLTLENRDGGGAVATITLKAAVPEENPALPPLPDDSTPA